jgi:hypothetical protein
MPFAITNAKALADSWTDETIDAAKALIWGNEFIQNEVRSRVWAETTYEYTDLLADTWYDLPSGFVRTVQVEYIVNNESEFCGYIIISACEYIEEILLNKDSLHKYIIRNRQIKFSAAGTYKLTYVGYPSKVEDIYTNIALHEAFEYPMAKFLLFKHLSTEYDDEDMKPEAERYRQEYLMDIKKIYDEIEMDSENESFRVLMRW